jgi:CheY-like chemotaxis protein
MPKLELDQPKETLQGMKVLVIDDMPITLESMQNTFDLVDLTITTAENGEEALDILTQDPNFDLIITDKKMPYMNGIKFLEFILADPSITTCKTFILQTASVSLELIKYIENLDAQAKRIDPEMQIKYIHKTYSIQDFFNFLDSVITSQSN